MRRVARVSTITPPLNKLAQLTSSELYSADVVILCDCDLAFAGDIRSVVSLSCVGGRVTGYPNPTLEVWRRLLAETKLNAGPIADCAVEGSTIHQNLNGGLLTIPKEQFLVLRESWPRWASWLENRIYLLDRWAFHIDQVSFALACIENNILISHLPVAYNYPAQIKDRLIGDSTPLVLHYHNSVDASGLIQRTGQPIVDAVIDRLNKVMGRVRLYQFS